MYLASNFEAFDAARPKNYDYSLLAVRNGATDPIDWTTKGAVTPVKDQAQCGSCWAFSTVAGMEGALYVSASPRCPSRTLSCDKNGDQGCNGGLMDNAFEWINKNGGICSESDYPYTSGTGCSGTCQKT